MDVGAVQDQLLAPLADRHLGTVTRDRRGLWTRAQSN